MSERQIPAINPITPNEVGHNLIEDHKVWRIHILPGGGVVHSKAVDPEIQARMPVTDPKRKRLGPPFSVRIRAFIDGLFNN